MYNNRVKNIIINTKPDGEAAPNDMQLRLADYYTRAYAKTVERLHLSGEEKQRAISAVNMEYDELVSYGRRDCLEMVS